MTKAVGRLALLLMLALAVPALSLGQVLKGSPVVYGHHHLNVSNLDDAKKFWITALGGTVARLGQLEVVRFPGVVVMMSAANKPTGGTKTSTVDHVGFQVPNLRATVDRLRTAGYPIVTKAELATDVPYVEKDGVAVVSGTTTVAFVMGPDETKVELIETKDMKEPISLHHIHFAGPAAEMAAWYAKVLGTTVAMRGPRHTAPLPGVSLTFTQTSTPTVPTRGRVLDHIGFEIDNLDAFTKKLESMGIKLDRPYTKMPQFGLAIAFITDPWGTYIELTDGMRDVQ